MGWPSNIFELGFTLLNKFKSFIAAIYFILKHAIVRVWKQRFVLTVIVRYKVFRWIDRPLSRMLGLEPRMLSNRINRNVNQSSLHESFQLWAWPQQSSKSAIFLGTLFALDLWLIAVAISRYIPLKFPNQPHDQSDSLALAIGATAFCGTVLGFTQAIVAFMSQMRSQQSERGLSFIALVVRKHYSYWVFAFAAGLTILNAALSFSLLLFRTPEPVIVWILLIDLMMIPALTIVSLWFLTRMLIELGVPDIDTVISIYRSLLTEIHQKNVEFKGRENLSKKLLEEVGIKFDFHADSRIRMNLDDIPVYLYTGGHVSDIDCYKLRSLSQKIQQAFPARESIVSVLVGSSVNEKDRMLLKSGSDKKVSDDDLEPKAPDYITKLLNDSFVILPEISPESLSIIDREVANFQNDQQLMTLSSALKNDTLQFNQRLDNYRQLLSVFLNLADELIEPPSRRTFFQILNNDLTGPLDYDFREIAQAGAESGNPKLVADLADHLSTFAADCLRQGQLNLVDHYLDNIVTLYYRCAHSNEMLNSISKRIDSSLSYFYMRREHPLENSDTSPEIKQLYTDTIIRFTLRLTHAAMRYMRTADVEMFVSRIYGHRNHGYRHVQIDAQNIDNNDEFIFDITAIALTGWSLQVIQSGVLSDNSSATAALNLAKVQLPNLTVLVAEWEIVRAGKHRGSVIDKRLGIDNWETDHWTRELRPGISHAYSPSDWFGLGGRVGLLLAGRSPWPRPEDLMPTPPDRHLWDLKNETVALQKLLANEHLNIPEAQREERLKQAIDIISDRERFAKCEYLRSILDAKITEEHLQPFRVSTNEAFLERQTWLDAIVKADGNQPSIATSTKKVRFPIWTSSLLDSDLSQSSFAGHVGEVMANTEAMEVAYALESATATSNVLQSIKDLPSSIRKARKQLQDSGYEPDIVLLPNENRLAQSIFDKPLWEIDGHSDIDRRLQFGNWEGLLILKYPYSNTDCALVMDSAHSLASHTDPTKLPNEAFRLILDDEDMLKANDAARMAIDDSSLELPKAQTLQTVLEVAVESRFGINDPKASIRIDLLQSDAAFIIVNSTYHRPDCSILDDKGVQATRSLSEPSKEAQACTECHPEQWEHEARSSK